MKTLMGTINTKMGQAVTSGGGIRGLGVSMEYPEPFNSIRGEFSPLMKILEAHM